METDTAYTVSQSESDDEEILIEFPAELIPDEYEHENEVNGLVYGFGDEGGKRMSRLLLDGLRHHGYIIPDENQFEISTFNQLLNKVEQLAEGDFTNKSSLIVVVIAENSIFKHLLFENTASKIWSPFMENKSLKYKPKIFIFYEYEEESDIATDFQIKNEMKTYDVPSEADVLIVYQKSTDINIHKGIFGFLADFCENLKEYGKRDDLVGILTRSHCDQRPLIISTLRKKFYVSSSHFREHFYDIQSNNMKILKSLEMLREKFTETVAPRTLSQNAMETDGPTAKPSTSKVRKAKIVTDGPSKKLTVGKNNKCPSTRELRKPWKN